MHCQTQPYYNAVSENKKGLGLAMHLHFQKGLAKFPVKIKKKVNKLAT